MNGARIWLVCLASSLGCAAGNWQPLNASALKASAPRSISVVLSKAPRFVVPPDDSAIRSRGVLPVDLLSGLLAGAIEEDRRRGVEDKVVADNHLVDPSINIRKQLLYALANAYGLQVRTSIEEPDYDSQTSPGDADLVLEAKTIDWALSHTATDHYHHRLVYRFQLELRDTRKGKRIAFGVCDNLTDDERSNLSFGELLMNDAAVLKGELAKAEALCLSRFQGELLAMTAAQ